MSNFTAAWSELYAVQTAETGVAILATVGGLATNKPAILSEATFQRQFDDGTTAEAGGYTLEMLISDFSAIPTPGLAVTCNGSATGMSLQVLPGVRVVNNATYLFSIGDINA